MGSAATKGIQGDCEYLGLVVYRPGTKDQEFNSKVELLGNNGEKLKKGHVYLIDKQDTILKDKKPTNEVSYHDAIAQALFGYDYNTLRFDHCVVAAGFRIADNKIFVSCTANAKE